MERTSDPNIPPAYVLNTLHAAGYEPYAVDEGHSLWRLPGEEPKTWREAMEEVGVESARMRAEIITVKNDLMVSEDRNMELNSENRTLREQMKSRTGEFILTALTVVPTSAAAVFLGLEALLPSPWGHLCGVIGAGLAAQITRSYTGHRPQLPEGKKD